MSGWVPFRRRQNWPYDPEWRGPWVGCRFPEKHREFLWANPAPIWPEPEKYDLALAVIQAGGILILCGQRGTGKTLMAAALASSFGKTPLYFTARDLMNAIKGWLSLESVSQIHNQAQLNSCPLLVIDELHERIGTGYEDGELTHLVDKRYGSMIPTVLIVNLPAGELQRNLGASILSRTVETGAIVELSWPSFRGTA